MNYHITAEYLRTLTGVELAYLLRQHSERTDTGGFAAVQAIAQEIARRQQAHR
jgi:hypothetical protein